MTDISIFIITHKKDVFVPNNPLFKLLQVGCANNNEHFENMYHDDQGVNISKKNPYYCELTGIYWAWKNIDVDYYGIFHYRRYLSFSNKEYPIKHMPFVFGEVVENKLYTDNVNNKYCLDEMSMRKIIESYDYIAPCKVKSLDGSSIYNQYKLSYGHHIEDLDLVMSIIKEDYPEYVPAMESYIFGKNNYTCNMFIMKKELFNQYCSWIFTILEKFERKRNFYCYRSVDNRVVGYLAERLTGIFITFLNNNDCKGKELQRVYFKSTSQNDIPEQTKEPVLGKIKLDVRRNIAKCESFAKKELKSIYYNLRYKPLQGNTSKVYHKNNNEQVTNMFIDNVKIDDNGFYIINCRVEHIFKKLKTRVWNFCIDILDENQNNIIVGDICYIEKKYESYFKNPAMDKYSISFFFNCLHLPSILKIRFEYLSNDYMVDFDRSYLEAKHVLWKNTFFNASQFECFDNWFDEHKVSESDLAKQHINSFNIQPKYSIVVPLYETPINFLEEMINSVLNQSYGNFELILVNASPNNRVLYNRVVEYTSKDKRIISLDLDENLGITENTNFGIDAAKGDFIAFLDHDDTIEPDTLYEYTKYLNEHPDTDLFYCDEDKIIKDKHIDPYFKPDFNIDLLCGINYVCHFLTCRTSIVKQIERPTNIYDGAQDHNMTFRVSEYARHIAHIPRVLYHWRIHEDSTASDTEQKAYTLEAARIAIEHYLQRRGLDCDVIESPRVSRHYEVLYKLPEHPKVSIIIPNKNSYELLKGCVDSIISRSTYDNYEIVIVDNQSSEKELFNYYESRKQKDNIKVVSYDKAYNFSAIVNFGVKNSTGDYVILLNNDTSVITDCWIEKMLGPCMREDIGAVGPKLLFPDNTVQHAGIIITDIGPCHLNYGLTRYAPGYYNTAVLPMDVSAVTGACIMCKKSTYLEVGGFDEMLATNYNDVDFCLKLRNKGLLVLCNTFVELYHYEGMSRENEEKSENGRIKMKKALSILMSRYPQYFANGDPFYNINFAKNFCYFSL